MVEVMKINGMEWKGGHNLWLAFSDGTEGVWNAEALLRNEGPMLAPLRDPAYFGRVFRQLGVPVWPNGFALDPRVLHDEIETAGNLAPTRMTA